MLTRPVTNLLDKMARHMCEGAIDVTLDAPPLINLAQLVREHRQEVLDHLARQVEITTRQVKTVRAWSALPRLAPQPIMRVALCALADSVPRGREAFGELPGGARYEVWAPEGRHVRLKKVY